MTAGDIHGKNAELEALGDAVERVEVEVKEDKVHGTIRPAAGVAREQVEERAKEILGQHTIRYTFHWE